MKKLILAALVIGLMLIGIGSAQYGGFPSNYGYGYMYGNGYYGGWDYGSYMYGYVNYMFSQIPGINSGSPIGYGYPY